MTITYKFNDGTESVVEVDENVGTVIIDSRKEEHANNEKQRYHCNSLEELNLSENHPGSNTTESDYTNSVFLKEFYEIYDTLTETQKRRIEMIGAGLSLREIARQEGVNLSKIQKSINQIQKKFKKIRK